MNNSDQFRKLVLVMLRASIPTLVALISAYLALIFGEIALAGGAAGFAAAWLFQELRYIDRETRAVRDDDHA